MYALTCWFVEPEVGFEPTTFRLRVGFSASVWSAPDGSSLLTLDAASVQTALEGSRRIVWMIKWMIKAHPTENRMARQATTPRAMAEQQASLRRRGPAAVCPVTRQQQASRAR
jgi:hypothetical protein